MPSTPLITVTTQTGYIQIAVSNPGAAPSYNILERASQKETGGSFIKLTTTLQPNETFTDWNVASGENYIYRLRAVDAGGATADSATTSATLTLAQAYIHAVTKTSRNTNRYNSLSLSLADLIPHVRPSAYQSEVRELSGLAKGDITLGEILEESFQFTGRIQKANDSDRATLESIFSSKAYLCIRDVLGNKYIGTLEDHHERYEHGFTDVPIVLTKCAFNEAVE